MRRFILGLVASVLTIGGLSLLATPAMAEDHFRDHREFENREVQHFDHDIYRDMLERQRLQQPYYYAPQPVPNYYMPYYGYGYPVYPYGLIR